MATFPSLPGPRLPYDKDGTIVQTHLYLDWSGLSSVVSDANKSLLNSERLSYAPLDTGGGSGGGGWSWLFPTPTRLLGYAIHWTGQHGKTIEYSTDTTVINDGTWVALAANVAPLSRMGHRSITNVDIANVKAIRIRGVQNYSNVSIAFAALYGTNTLTGLKTWHPTLNQEAVTADFDFGDMYLNHSISVKQFRIKNTSSMTANNITVSLRSNTNDLTPSTTSYASLSLDNVSYGATVNLGNLAPGAISGIVYVKYAPVSPLLTGPWVFTVDSTAASWS